MTRKKLMTCWIPSLLLLVMIAQANAVDDSGVKRALKIGEPMPAFTLKDFRGKSVDSNEFASSKAVAVVFMGVECPLVKLYSSRLMELQETFEDDLKVIGINSNRHDSVTEMANFAKLTGVDFPLLKDPANRVADLFGAQRTPDVYLFNAAGELCYRGAIDDQYTYGRQKNQPEKMFLLDAVKAVVSHQKPKIATTDSVGCIIGRIREQNAESEVTYANQISRLLNERCVNCHRPGEIAPFSLTDYEEVVGWAEMIQEVVDDRRMPPWHANPAHGKFKNDNSLTQQQHELIDTWVKNGAPLGDPKDLPDPPTFVEGWRIGKPDFQTTITKKPVPVPATGEIPYEHFVVDPGFTEDKWVQAAECRIGNRSVVHHIIVAVMDREGKSIHLGQIENEWLTATAPGAPPLILPEGYAKLIPAGSKLVFQMHYTPNGTEQTDLSSVGFKFADPNSVRKSVGTIEVLNTKFRIPPGAENHKVTARHRFDADSMILSLFPHMHLRGKSFEYKIKTPGSGNDWETILDIPNYDFNWQNGYHFEEPLKVPAGTELLCIAHFDNSAKNFANPDPDTTVGWGDQTWDEMMIGYFDMALTDQDLTKPESNTRTQSLLKRIESSENLITEDVKTSAGGSLKSSQNMEKFGYKLRSVLPNVDRVCWTTTGDQLSVRRVAQVLQFQKKCGGEGQSSAAAGTKILEIQKSGQPTAIADLREIQTGDMRFMSAAAKSSFHIPVMIQDQPGTINFWSSEIDAFPEPIQELLVNLVNQSLASQ